MHNLLLGPIVGGLSHRRAHLWGKADGPGALHAWLGQEPFLVDARLAGQSLPLKAENGYTGVAPISGLFPDTSYYYALTLGSQPPDPIDGPYPEFTTFPLPGQPRPFSFAFGSCFRPVDEHSGKIFRELELHRKLDELRFILMIGDQIYADDYNHNGLNSVACNLDEYRQVYQHVWSNQPLRELLKNLPAFMILDDHEVDDDWTWADADRQRAQIPIWNRILRWLRRRAPWEWKIPQQRVQDALQAYWEHQGMHAPPLELPLGLDQKDQYVLDPADPGSLAYTFTFGAAAFFVMDSRTMRVKSRSKQSILGEEQWQALEGWLLAVKDDYPLKFLVSSGAVLFQMWVDLARDRWSGFPQERQRLLHFLAANEIEGVYILCGDLHSTHAIRTELYGPQGQALPLWEFCSSPFEQQPNWLARHTYSPVRNRLIRDQKNYFTIAENNFGVVRVDFNESGKPQVGFEVVGENGERLAQVQASDGL
jgi:phosphodiesterase/alkaline phosphatase D-like protein